MSIENRCIWCGSTSTYMMGATGFIIWHHCTKCSADFAIDMSEYAWSDKEVKEHDEKYKK